MIKNKILLCIYLGMATQPLCSIESAQQPKNTKNNTSSWARSPWLWGGVALAGAVGAWVYKKYQDYKKNVSQPEGKRTSNIKVSVLRGKRTIVKTEQKKEIDPYNFIYRKYVFYLNNKLDNKNFFEKTKDEQNIKNKPKNALTQKTIPIHLDNELLELEEKNLKFRYQEPLSNIINTIKGEKLYEKIKSIISANDLEKEKLLLEYVNDFLITQTKIFNIPAVKSESDLRYLCDCLLLYYEPTQTLRKIKEQEEKKERGNYIKKINQTLISNSTQEYTLPPLITVETLKTCNLCPPLEKPKTLLIRIVKNIEIKEDDTLKILPIIAEGAADSATSIPCAYSFKKNGQDRTIFQIKSINQVGGLNNKIFEAVGDNCPWISLFNCYCLYNFYTKNNFSSLRNLLNIDQIKKFYKKVQNLVEKINKEKNYKPTETIGKQVAKMDESTLKDLIVTFDDKQFTQHVSIIDNLTGFDHGTHGLTTN